MMMHPTAPCMMNQSSVAIIAAREDEALTHGQVMYGLIKPTRDMQQVESTAAMVNVVPKKRIYRMETTEEIDLFTTELMKRPLVIQPSAFIGRGIAKISCTLYTKEERWVVMLNQTHPLIQSKIQQGVETAKTKMAQGEPFILKLVFNDFLKKIYLDQLTRAPLNPKFTFIQFEDAEIVIRYPGDRFHRGVSWEFKTPEIKLTFNDLESRNVVRRTVQMATTERNNPALTVVPHEELHRLLPGWKFNEDDSSLTNQSDLPPSYSSIEAQGTAQGEHPETASPVAPARVVGRAKRKANASVKQEIPVELHVPEPGGPQILHRGNGTPSPTNHYENLNRQQHENEHLYSISNTYAMVDMSQRKEHNPGSPTSPVSPKTPDFSRLTPARSTPRTQDLENKRSPSTQHSGPRTDRYNDYSRSPSERQQVQTSLKSFRQQEESDEEFGFSKLAPVSKPELHYRQQEESRYDQNDKSNDNEYRNKSKWTGSPHPQDEGRNQPNSRYQTLVSPNLPQNETRSPNTFTPQPEHINQFQTPQRPDYSMADRPSTSPRDFHHTHQGSGRSGSSASDSGFGDNEGESFRNRQNPKFKTPYYNHGFEQDHENGPSVEDIMAKHKALASKVLNQSHGFQGQGHYNTQDKYNTQDYYNNSSYNRELQKWRQNINDLEDACGDTRMTFSKSRLQIGSNGEPMDESFI